ncbi:hypothetical protein XELAEV_18021902mg [Xenopus laevis]|uniref:Uncharacterized protein n=1 Tax=Xenopus laevis TaxID=8355 RepID=A0A974HN66_XENLA|nr:hypothetical protein XELAEV_18021902mg [Xenopus laevis]
MGRGAAVGFYAQSPLGGATSRAFAVASRNRWCQKRPTCHRSKFLCMSTSFMNCLGFCYLGAISPCGLALKDQSAARRSAVPQCHRRILIYKRPYDFFLFALFFFCLFAFFVHVLNQSELRKGRQ